MYRSQHQQHQHHLYLTSLEMDLQYYEMSQTFYTQGSRVQKPSKKLCFKQKIFSYAISEVISKLEKSCLKFKQSANTESLHPIWVLVMHSKLDKCNNSSWMGRKWNIF